MTFLLILGFAVAGAVLFLRWFLSEDGKSRERFRFVFAFMNMYEEKTGIRLTYDQALALIQVTLNTMSKSPADRVYLEERCHMAQKMTEALCAEAERNAFKKL